MDIAYLLVPKAKSRIAGYFYCGNNSSKSLPQITLNSPVHVECKVSQYVITSRVEVEMAGLFYNFQTATYLYQMLQALGHPQRPTAVKIDNGTASQFISNTIKKK